MNCDIVIKTFSRDYNRCLYLLKSIKNFFNGYNKIYIFLDDENGVQEFIDDGIKKIVKADVRIVPCSYEDGYMKQQYYKLNGGRFSDAEYLLPLDSDMVFYRPSTPADWLYDGLAFINYGNWSSPQNFPTTSLITSIIRKIGHRTHDLNSYNSCIRDSINELDIKVIEDIGSKIVLLYEGRYYDIDSSRPHTTWLSSIKNISEKPIDTMRLHYIFTKSGLNYINKFITDYTKQDLFSSILNIEKFPVFSEYQVYGNIINLSNHNEYGHILFEENSNEYHFASKKLPIIKCNTRQESSFFVYEEIINGKYACEVDRYHVLNKIRTERAHFSGEEWH